MARGYLIDDLAEAELDEAIFWYESEREGLGLRFLEAVHAVARHAVDFPESGSPAPNVPADVGARRFTIRPFPHWLVTLPVKDVLVVIAIASQQRRPNYWQDRLPKAPR